LSIDLVGWVAIVLTQVFYVPNTIRIIRTRDVQGYSLFAWLLLTAGIGCYLVYFAARGDVIGIVANACGVSGAALTTFCIWLWRPRPRRAAGQQGPMEIQAIELTDSS
jgi:lipid-A-disaccharide synthase-like uncharacterized protein